MPKNNNIRNSHSSSTIGTTTSSKKSESSKTTFSSGGVEGIKKKRVNAQTQLVNSIRKKKMEKALQHEYELEKLHKEEERNDFLSKINDENAVSTVEGQFDMMRGLLKKTNKRSGLDMFDDDDDAQEENHSSTIPSVSKKDDQDIDEERLVKTSEQQYSILEKVLSKKQKSDEFKKKYESKIVNTTNDNTAQQQYINKHQPVAAISTPASSPHQATSQTQQQAFTGDNEMPFIKAPITKTICLHCEREKTPKGMMIKYIVIINEKDEVVYHCLSEEVKNLLNSGEDPADTTSQLSGLGEVTYSLMTIRDHVSKILRKTFVIVGHTIFHNLIGIFGPRNVHEFKSKLRDVGVVDPNTEQKYDTTTLTNIPLILSRLLGLTNTKKMNRVEIAINMLKSYKLHAKVFDQFSKRSSLDLLGYEERQLMKREQKAHYQQKYMTTINNGIDNILAQMKKK
ncbi:hypothetical protein FDP41_011563 [Naegleria fowleri]|uniref:Uncharacterized protein n=1 Tax=Naegleria fowleri TaxID=5763 RepID=A0A6A5BX16_NAEFO|nr:uncharacterized protein FDP41_011563 [Naegleria fowleri]KAF0982633.1 hypothetical protein FDP41_011563 [Naegleria fowleri]CAG4715768.1 unnamed protein product [Naegleria fowleri]